MLKQLTTTYVNTLLRHVLFRQLAGSRMSPDFSNYLCIGNMVPFLCKLSFLCNKGRNFTLVELTPYLLYFLLPD